MEEYTCQEEYLRDLEGRAALPAGFRAASVPLDFFPEERRLETPLPMALTLLELVKPTDSFAGVFTRNAFPGAPVIIGRERISRRDLQVRGVLINNKVANAGAPGGRERAEELLEALAEAYGPDSGARGTDFFPASTGVIGWSLPTAAMKRALAPLLEARQDDTVLPAARGIMTTDAYPKVRSCRVGEGRITAIAKGAGMIEPCMGTMLVYILTDLDIPREELQEALGIAAAHSFNRISIDGDQSTSDMALILSSRRIRKPEGSSFQGALERLCADLARDIVRNGEGTTHVIEVCVEGAPGEEAAEILGKGILNSPLVKTAVFGNDPNVGRLLGALGDAWGGSGGGRRTGWGPFPVETLTLFLWEEPVFTGGQFELDPEKEERLSSRLADAAFDNSAGFPPHDKKVILRVDLGVGPGRAVVWGSDLSYGYVRENADYRT